MVTEAEWKREYLYGGRTHPGDDLIPLAEKDIRAIASAPGGPSITSTLAARLLKAEQDLRDLREHDAHLPSSCTYDDPNGEEVLAFRDVRHIVVEAERYRILQGAYEYMMNHGCDCGEDHFCASEVEYLRKCHATYDRDVKKLRDVLAALFRQYTELVPLDEQDGDLLDVCARIGQQGGLEHE